MQKDVGSTHVRRMYEEEPHDILQMQMVTGA